MNKKIITGTLSVIGILVAVFVVSRLSTEENPVSTNLRIHAHTLATEAECVELLGKQGSKLIDNKKKNRSLYPIKITVENNTGACWSLQRVDLIQEKKESVRDKIISPRWPFIIACGALAGVTIALPVAFCGLCTGYAIGILTLPIQLGGDYFGWVSVWAYSGWTLFWSGTTAGSMALAHQHKQSTATDGLKQLDGLPTLQELATVRPSSSCTAYIFVKAKNYKETFTMIFKNSLTNEEIPYTIQLNPSAANAAVA